EESTSAIASRLNSSVYRFVYLLPTWCYFLWNLKIPVSRCPRSRGSFSLYSILPARAEGEVIIKGAGPDDEGLYYALVPDPGQPHDATPRVNLSLESTPRSLHGSNEPGTPQDRRSVFRRNSRHLIELPTGSPRPATNLAYSWLVDDLKAVGWLRHLVYLSD
ncbi:hypothetical protein AB0468_16575, partial [Streptomyces sp. NPDC091278]